VGGSSFWRGGRPPGALRPDGPRRCATVTTYFLDQEYVAKKKRKPTQKVELCFDAGEIEAPGRPRE